MKNSNLVFGGIIIVLVFAAGFYFISLNPTDNASETEQSDNNDQDPINLDTNDTVDQTQDLPTMDKGATAGGEYVPYQESLLARADGNDVVLFFSAVWCPTCQALERDLQDSLDDIPDDLTILELDFDTEQTLREKYGVTIQHTLISVDSNGNELKKWVGGNTLESIMNQLF